MNRALLKKQSRIFDALSKAGLILVQPGFPVEQRNIFGLHDDSSDLAISLKWRDAAGCEWEADFTEGSLMSAFVAHNHIALKDSEGETVSVEFYDLKAGQF